MEYSRMYFINYRSYIGIITININIKKSIKNKFYNSTCA